MFIIFFLFLVSTFYFYFYFFIFDGLTICHPSPTTRYLSPATPHPLPVTRYPSPATRHPLPATRHPPPVTRHPPPATRGKVLPCHSEMLKLSVGKCPVLYLSASISLSEKIRVLNLCSQSRLYC